MSKVREIISEEEKQHQEKELRRIYRLSRRSVGLAAALGFVFPLGAYLYTRRWKALGIFFSILFLVGLMIPQEDPDDFSPSIAQMILAGIAAAVDNTKAIQWAKEQIDEKLEQE
ncbi:hypothetical protein [Thermostichus vulcanus]|uniref:Uncharacterized protein n=1 Tax=Thermostichus vulcanus str. 'Rupite' TaxID=2813851 RepID=A0ABT0C769_THEVL|nr:hypothetical protein [Thermostichus vulcanus]MCJ2541557.1 hypothetical protein [Thermostichus vulcanus str. 'Rupite']